MRIVRGSRGWLAGALAVAVGVAGAGELAAQNTKMPSTLRYGSGYLDVPAASVLPHMAITGTYSGFYVDIAERILTNAQGQAVGRGGSFEKWVSDGSVAIGLFDRVELGASFQQFNDAEDGGTIVGGFGKLAILRPEQQGIGLAVGARVLTAPSFDDIDPNEEYQAPRLGFADSRFYEDYGAGMSKVETVFTPYVVAQANLRGIDTSFLPRHDWSFTAGWGDGLFRRGDDLDWYAFTDSDGWIVGSAVHIELGETSMLNVLGDWNGFDVNLGAQLDFGGIRIGGFVLGVNYSEKVTEYRSRKFGVLGSVALCPNAGGLCRPSLMERVRPDTVQLPPPPPDTVVVEREVAPPLPTGTPARICIATGENVDILVTAQGDTLVGPQRVSVRTLRPGVAFAGTYAEGMQWFETDQAITYERREYQKSGGEVRLDCNNIRRVGEHMGVPLFADATAQSPYETLYVPVRPGVWQAYQTGLPRTRG